MPTTILHATDQVYCKHCDDWHPVAPDTVDPESLERAVTNYRYTTCRAGHYYVGCIDAVHSPDAPAARLDLAKRFAHIGMLPALERRKRMGGRAVSERQVVREPAIRPYTPRRSQTRSRCVAIVNGRCGTKSGAQQKAWS